MAREALRERVAVGSDPLASGVRPVIILYFAVAGRILMHMTRWIRAGCVLTASAVVSVGLLGGCSDEAKQSGTQVEMDKEAHAEGQRRMREYMEKKAKQKRAGSRPGGMSYPTPR